MLKKFFKQKGQVLVLFAIALPILFIFVAAAADFGYLYYNQSRLQNAADAAVTAGSKQLIFDEQNLSDYTYSTFVANSDEGLQRMIEDKIISKRKTDDGDKIAKEYAKKNLETWLNKGETLNLVDISDGKNSTTPDAPNTVKFKRVLYGSDENDYQALYYTVILSEKLSHLFSIMDNFDFVNLNSKVMAVAKITHVIEPVTAEHGVSLYQQMTALKRKECYPTWDHIKHEYEITPDANRPEGFKGLDVTNCGRRRSVQAKGNEFASDYNHYRTETLTLHGWSKVTQGNGTPSNISEMDQRKIDALFVDLKADWNGYTFKKDQNLDLGGDITLIGKDNVTYINDSKYNLTPDNKNINSTSYPDRYKEILNYRIHDLINVGRWHKTGVNPDGTETGYYTYEYPVRSDNEREPPDPLYVYIENENIYNHEYQSGTTAFNTVRQMIININAANTDEETQRPMMFFYDGPENLKVLNNKNTWNEEWREAWKHMDEDYYKNNCRNSLPVIINFYEDFRGTFFFPNSPVVINGNGYKLTGFVVALEFLQLKTAEDFPEIAEGGTLSDERGCDVYKDDKGNVLYHAAAKGGKRYVQIVTQRNPDGTPKKDANGNNLIQYRNVIYAQGDFSESDKNPATDTIYEEDEIYKDPDGNFVELKESDVTVLYTYTLIDQEKSNLLSTYTGDNAREKDFVPVSPMFIDKWGNVQYKHLEGDSTYSDVNTGSLYPWHNDSASNDTVNYNADFDSSYEVIYKPSTFGLREVEYSGFNKVGLINYTKLNNEIEDSEGGESYKLNDVFYATKRSDWID